MFMGMRRRTKCDSDSVTVQKLLPPYLDFKTGCEDVKGG